MHPWVLTIIIILIIVGGHLLGGRKRPLIMLQNINDDIPIYSFHVRFVLISFYFDGIKLLILIGNFIVKFIYNGIGNDLINVSNKV